MRFQIYSDEAGIAALIYLNSEAGHNDNVAIATAQWNKMTDMDRAYMIAAFQFRPGGTA